MSRQNQILSILLALQIVAAAVVFWPRPAATAAGGSLFAGVTADKIAKLTVSDASGQVQLVKGPNGWILPQADDYPCLANKVQPLLDKIVALKTDRLVTQTSASHKQLKVAYQNFERSIEFELADGTRHRLYLGTSAGYQTTHVRVQGKNQVYLAAGLSAADASAQASGWVETAYFSAPQDQVTALTVENKNGRFELEKNAHPEQPGRLRPRLAHVAGRRRQRRGHAHLQANRQSPPDLDRESHPGAASIRISHRLSGLQPPPAHVYPLHREFE